MNLQQIGQLLTNVINKLNLFETNSKKIFELPVQSTLVPTSKLAAYNPTSDRTEQLEIQKIISGITQTYIDRLIYVGELVIVGNNVTVPTGAQALINNVTYFTAIDFTFNIPFSAAGKSRTDIIVMNVLSQLVLISGFETAGVAVRPNVPLGTVLVTQINVTDSGFLPVIALFFIGEFASEAALTTAYPTARAGSYAIVGGNSVYFYSGVASDWFAVSGGGGSTAPIQYLTLRKKANGSTDINSPIQIGDIVEGFKDSTTYWTSAIYNGGDINDRANYTPIVETDLT